MDPVGHIRVKGRIMQTQKVYPLILACLETGGIHVEMMGGMEAKDGYLSILQLQYIYNTNVFQLFSDGGSQLNAKLLGRKRSYYQEKLHRLWGVHNNTPHSQHRNLVERKILIKEGAFGMPGPA